MVIVVDIDKVAALVGLTAEGFKDRLADLGLAQVVSEAHRLAHQQAFNGGGKFPAVPKQTHVVAAAKSLLS